MLKKCRKVKKEKKNATVYFISLFLGMFSNISDDTKSGPFLNATINYINKRPKPWDKVCRPQYHCNTNLKRAVRVNFAFWQQFHNNIFFQATEQLFSFMMGMMSNQVSDSLWTSLGVEQGFLSTMGYVCYVYNMSILNLGF